MPAHRKLTPEKCCQYCSKKLERKRLPNGDLEYLIHFNRRKYCDRFCMARAFEERPKKDDPGWSTAHYHARKIVKSGPCERCGSPNALDAHHKDGNWRNNLPENLERICRSCHNKVHRERQSCKICGKPQKGLGYCNKHYLRFKRHGDPLMVKRARRMKCEICGELAHAKGLCGKHYMQAKRAGLLAIQGSSATPSQSPWLSGSGGGS